MAAIQRQRVAVIQPQAVAILSIYLYPIKKILHSRVLR